MLARGLVAASSPQLPTPRNSDPSDIRTAPEQLFPGPFSYLVGTVSQTCPRPQAPVRHLSVLYMSAGVGTLFEILGIDASACGPRTDLRHCPDEKRMPLPAPRLRSKNLDQLAKINDDASIDTIARSKVRE